MGPNFLTIANYKWSTKEFLFAERRQMEIFLQNK